MRHVSFSVLRIASIALVASSTLLTVQPVLAASCNPHRSADGNSHWMGVSDALSGARAVYSEIKTYNPFVTGNGFSYAWVMLPGPLNNEWAQIGPYKSASQLVTAVQWRQPSDSAATQMNFAATTVGSVHQYSVGFAPTTHTFVFYLDGITKASTALSWTPSGAEIYSEIWQLSSQLMGDASSKESFGNNQIMNTAGNWQGYSGTLSSPTSHFSDSGSALSFLTWDLCI